VKTVGVIVRSRDPARIAEALRAAVGLTLRGARVLVSVGAAPGDPVGRRALDLLREMGHEVGVAEEQIALDPGLDFDLSVKDGLEILRRLRELRKLGRPLYVSLSRKDFLGAVLAGSWDSRAPAQDREWATASAAALAVTEGADLLRLHDASALQAMRIAAEIAGGPRGAFSSSTVEKAPRVASESADG